MRDLKFRCWSRETKKMYWFDVLWGAKHGSGGGWIAMIPIEETERQIHPDNRILVDPDDCEFMQYTNLVDKNGKEIYHGHIVADDEGKIREVKWNGQNAQFYLSNNNRYKEFIECGQSQSDGPVYCDTIEIIGNIYEHPELLNQLEQA